MIADELAAARRPIDVGALNASIFNNLIPDYSEIIAAMAVREGGPIGFTTLSNMLVSHEVRLNHA